MKTRAISPGKGNNRDIAIHALMRDRQSAVRASRWYVYESERHAQENVNMYPKNHHKVKSVWGRLSHLFDGLHLQAV